MHRMLWFLLVMAAPLLRAQDSNQPRTPPVRKLWLVSLATLAAANGADIHSSWGKPERNAALAGPNGAFGARGVLLKSGLQGGLMATEILLLRRRPGKALCRFLTVVNFGAAAVVSGTAVHNYRMLR